MSKNTKIAVGILTVLPLIGIFFYIGFIFRFIMTIQNSDSAPDTEVLKNIFIVATLLIVSILLNIGLLVFYIVHAVNNKKLESNERVMWVLLFVFISTIAFMIYWVLRIWQDKESKIAVVHSEFLDEEI
jgi:uncharacterized membrane protein